MNEQKAIALFKCLADKSRLLILKSLMKEDLYVELLAERLDLTAATVSFHLRKLSDADAVSSYKSQYYTMYSLNREIFDISLLDILKEESDETIIQNQREEEYRQRVLASYFEYGRLITIPAQRKKKRIVLEEIVKDISYDRKYTEQEINQIILRYHDDFCTLRRDMIAEKLLNRDRNEYWKL